MTIRSNGSDTPRDKSIPSLKGLCKDKFLQTSYANTSMLPQFKASTKSLEYWLIGCTPSLHKRIINHPKFSPSKSHVWRLILHLTESYDTCLA